MVFGSSPICWHIDIIVWLFDQNQEKLFQRNCCCVSRLDMMFIISDSLFASNTRFVIVSFDTLCGCVGGKGFTTH